MKIYEELRLDVIVFTNDVIVTSLFDADNAITDDWENNG